MPKTARNRDLLDGRTQASAARTSLYLEFSAGFFRHFLAIQKMTSAQQAA